VKRVLITGGRGFIGRQCLPLLAARGFEVHATCTEPPAAGQMPGDERVAWHAVDLHDHAAVARLLEQVKPTHLLHLAWRAVHGDLWNTPQNLDWLQTSLALLRAFEAGGGQRVTVCGTCGEYDWADGLCREDHTPLRPNTFYGSCKHAIHVAAEGLGRISDLQVAWGRVFFVYGPGEHPNRLAAAVIRGLLRGEPVETSHGRQVRDYAHVADVADGLVTLLDHEATGAFNLATGQTLMLRDLIGEAARQIGRPELVKLGARPAAAHEPPIILADMRKTQQVLGWSPKLDLEAGVRQTIEWYRADPARGS